MKLKFWEREVREQAPYTDAFTSAVLSEISGGSTDVPVGLTGREEATRGLWGRSFAIADVKPVNMATAALNPLVLQQIGESLHDYGEVCFEIVIRGGQVVLIPAANWEVMGDYGRWDYQLELAGPDSTVTRYRPADAVLHLRYGSGVVRPWRGSSPGGRAATTRQLLANLDHKLKEETGGPVGNMMAVPDPQPGLQSDVTGLKGKTVLVKTTQDGWGDGERKPTGEYKSERVGADPPSVLEALRRSVGHDMASAAAVPPSILAGDRVDGTALRESWRQWLHGSLLPIAAIIQVELRAKLDTPDLTLSFSKLMASDIQGRARAYGSLRAAEMPHEQAAMVTGLMEGS